MMGFNYNDLKRLYMESPKIVKRIYASIPWSLRMGKGYRETYRFLEKSEGWSKEEWKDYQLSKLREIMEYCYRYVPYYKTSFDIASVNLANSDILAEYKKLPFLTKKEVVKNSDQFTSQEFDSQKLYKGSTGGTTGKPLTMYFDKQSYKKEWAFKIYSWNKAIGYTPDSPKATFRGVQLGGQIFYENPIYNEIRFSPFKMEERYLWKITDKLKEYDPEYLHGYPSAIEQLVKFLKKEQINLSVKGIILISENIFPHQVEVFKKYFEAPVYSFYGHSERCIFASMDSTLNDYFPHPAYGYTELIDEDGNTITASNITGELVGTGFINKGMPLLKYRTGDYSSWGQPKSESDWSFKSLVKIKGRWNQQFLVGANKEKVSLTALNMHSDVFDNINQHQFYQDTMGEVIFNVVKDEGYTISDEKKIKKQLMNKLGDSFELKVKYVDNIMLTQSGKSKYLIQHFN